MRGKDWNGKQPVLALLKLGLRMIFYLPQGVNTNSDFVEKDVGNTSLATSRSFKCGLCNKTDIVKGTRETWLPWFIWPLMY